MSKKSKNIKEEASLYATRYLFYLFPFRSYGLSKVHYCMVVVGFGTFQPFHFGGL